MGMPAIIPARGGSKRLPRKNILPLVGKPMINYTIEAALTSKYVDSVYVSTEDSEIMRVSVLAGAIGLPRPVELAGDNVSSERVVEWILRYNLGFVDYFVLLQATSPLRTVRQIDECIGIYKCGGYKSVVSCCLEEGTLWPNGAIYVVDTDAFLCTKSFTPGPCFLYEMDPASGIDIDTLDDFKKAEGYLCSSANGEQLR